MDGNDFSQQLADILTVLLEEDAEINATQVQNFAEANVTAAEVGLVLHCHDGAVYHIAISCERYPRWLVQAEEDALRKEDWELRPWRYR